MGLIPGWGRSPGEGNGNPPQYSCLGNPNGQRSLEGATVHRVAKESDMTYKLNNNNNLAFSHHTLYSTTFSKIGDDVHGTFWFPSSTLTTLGSSLELASRSPISFIFLT